MQTYIWSFEISEISCFLFFHDLSCKTILMPLNEALYLYIGLKKEKIMLGKSYIVKNGDTLSGIAATHLGDALRWPEVYDHNNKPAVVRVNGVKITNPDLIFVGQKIYIPGTPNLIKASVNARQKTVSVRPNRTTPQVAVKPKLPTSKPAPANAGKIKAAKKVRSTPIKYDLKDLPSITVTSPTYTATIALKGSVTLQSKNSVDFATLTTESFELSVKKEADHALGKLVTESQVGYNSKTNEVTLEWGMTSHSINPNALKTKVSVVMSSKTGLPVMKGSIIAPEIIGNVANHAYLAAGLAIEIEITPRANPGNQTPLPTAKPNVVPIKRPIVNPSTNWDYLLGTALVAGAAIIIVGTIVEDILTAGVGVADDAISFAVAGRMLTSGLVLFQVID